VQNSIKALARVSRLTVHSRLPRADLGGAEGEKFYRGCAEQFLYSPSARSGYHPAAALRRRANALWKAVTGRRLYENEWDRKRDYADLARAAAAGGVEIIWLGYGNVSYPLLKYLKAHCDLPVVVDTDSVWSRFVRRGMAFTANAAERRRREREAGEKEVEERWGTRLADVTTAVSAVDRDYYAALAGGEDRVRLFPNVIDLEDYSREGPKAATQRPALYLAGSFFDGSPMEEAARWVVREVLPLVWERLPRAHLYVLGVQSKEYLGDLAQERVEILGRVPSALPYLRGADVALVPLRFESGTRFKILEAAALEVPVVSTTLGAEGLFVRGSGCLRIADDPRDFAEEILQILQEPRESARMARRCREVVQESYGIPAATRAAEEIIALLGRGSGAATKP
jgi:glycosyltransferase involved in cell wall biosynthesis